MKIYTRILFMLMVVFQALTLIPSASAAETVVKVSLTDNGPGSMGMLSSNMMLGMGMMDVDMAMATMQITTDVKTVPSGEVTFEAMNFSKNFVHEMVVAPVADTGKSLPYDKTTLKVDEDAAGHLGEVAELEPGQSGALRINLKPGEYILYCNIPGHYALGMWTLITVS